MAGKVKNVWTTQGAGVWVNMDGQGKKDTEIVTAVADGYSADYQDLDSLVDVFCYYTD